MADEDHERGLGHVLALEAHDREDPRCVARSSTTPTTRPASWRRAKGQLNPYKLGVELYRHIEERWDRGQFGKEWEECDDLDAKKNWNLRLGLGKKKIFEVRALYNDVTFIDEFLTPDFCREHKLFSFCWSNRNERYEIETREFKAVKEKLLFQLTNGGNPFIYVEDANYDNRGELLLRHDHQGLDLRQDYAQGGHAQPRPRVEAPGERDDGRRGQAGHAPLRRQGAHDAAPRDDGRSSAGERAMTRLHARPGPLAPQAIRRTSGSAPGWGSCTRAETAYEQRERARRRSPGCKRAAGMALNAALIVEPNDAWGRTYVEHVAGAGEGRERAGGGARGVPRVLEAKPRRGRRRDASGRPAHDETVLEAARDVIAHAFAVVMRHET